MPYAATRSIEGTVAVITRASAGIGAATARTLVDARARVVLGARRKDRLDALVEELGEDTAVGVRGDVRDPEYNDVLVAAAVDRWGRLDTVVAYAGIGAYGGILDLDDAPAAGDGGDQLPGDRVDGAVGRPPVPRSG